MNLEITTRETYLVASALYREMKRQEALDGEQQDWCALVDIKDLLQRHFLPFAGLLEAIDRSRAEADRRAIQRLTSRAMRVNRQVPAVSLSSGIFAGKR